MGSCCCWLGNCCCCWLGICCCNWLGNWGWLYILYIWFSCIGFVESTKGNCCWLGTCCFDGSVFNSWIGCCEIKFALSLSAHNSLFWFCSDNCVCICLPFCICICGGCCITICGWVGNCCNPGKCCSTVGIGWLLVGFCDWGSFCISLSMELISNCLCCSNGILGWIGNCVCSGICGGGCGCCSWLRDWFGICGWVCNLGSIGIDGWFGIWVCSWVWGWKGMLGSKYGWKGICGWVDILESFGICIFSGICCVCICICVCGCSFCICGSFVIWDWAGISVWEGISGSFEILGSISIGICVSLLVSIGICNCSLSIWNCWFGICIAPGKFGICCCCCISWVNLFCSVLFV